MNLMKIVFSEPPYFVTMAGKHLVHDLDCTESEKKIVGNSTAAQPPHPLPLLKMLTRYYMLEQGLTQIVNINSYSVEIIIVCYYNLD